MKSVILCEGSTDFILLQYYMREANGWMFKSNNVINIKGVKARECIMTKDSSILSIIGCGGCNRIIPALSYIFEFNNISAIGEAFDNVIIITDRDEVTTEQEFCNDVIKQLKEYGDELEYDIKNNQWISYMYNNGYGDVQKAKLLLLIIPFEDTGAMETFLLKAIAADDEYDKMIIEKCNKFVEKIDDEKRYLKKRRYITKAKFDVFFSVRTSAQQFNERREILKNVQWEKYTLIQKSFAKLGEIDK